MCRSGSRQPRRPAAGTVTTTPRSGWMTTRRPRDRGERRSVYASGPPGNRATARCLGAISGAGHGGRGSAPVGHERRSNRPARFAGLGAIEDRRLAR